MNILEKLEQFLKEAKHKTGGHTVNKEPVEIRPLAGYGCDMFNATYKDKKARFPIIKSKIREFGAKKASDSMAPYGSADTRFVSNSPISSLLPGMRHAHLTKDLSVWYKITGGAAPIIKLYGIFTHEETGTGTPAKIAKQISISKKLIDQENTFAPLDFSDDKITS
jgi:hypothetical protein